MTKEEYKNFLGNIEFELREAKHLLQNAARLIATDFAIADEQRGSVCSDDYKQLLADVNTVIEKLNYPIHFYEDGGYDENE